MAIDDTRLALVIDDEAEVRRGVGDVLRLEGLEVYESFDGQDGIEMAEKLRPDIILCDVMMPRRNGFGVLTALRSNPNTALIPFVFLSSMSESDYVRRGMSFGADDYVTKPFRVDELLETVRARLSKRVQQQREIDELKKTLSRRIPHELLTPLNAVKGLAAVLADPNGPTDPGETRELASYIVEASGRLEHLVENYLLYVHLQNEQSSSEGAPSDRGSARTDIAELWPRVLARFSDSPHATERVRAELEPARISVADDYLFRVLFEVLDNALKFSDDEVQVHGRIGDGYHLSITDRGRGMRADQLRSVDAFVQFDRETFEQQGIGLGLSLARELLTSMGGAMRIESEPRVGTSVHIELPI